MPKKKGRLDRMSFKQFFSIGKRFQNPSFQFIYHPHPTFHLSVVISKKVLKSSVKRNKLRRRVRAIIENAEATQKKGGVFIVVAKPEAKDCSYEELSVMLRELIKRAIK